MTLPRIIGLRKAKELAITGELIDADEATDLTLVNEAVPDATLDDRIDDLLETLANHPTKNIGLTKRAIHNNLGRSWRDGLEREAYIQSLAYTTPAHEEGVNAFLEGRTPEFR